MRRRENFANRTREADPVAYQTANDPLATYEVKTVPGVCKKCGRHIGRGVTMHERRCDGG